MVSLKVRIIKNKVVTLSNGAFKDVDLCADIAIYIVYMLTLIMSLGRFTLEFTVVWCVGSLGAYTQTTDKRPMSDLAT